MSLLNSIDISCLWKVKMATEPIRNLTLVGDENLLIVWGDDQQVHIWSSLNGKYLDSLRQNQHKPDPIPIEGKEDSLSLCEAEYREYPEYDPFVNCNYDTVSNKEWNINLNFKKNLHEQHLLCLDTLNKLV